MKTSIAWFLLLLFFFSCTSINKNEPYQYAHYPNDASVMHLHGHVKKITETKYFEVEKVDNDYIIDSSIKAVSTYHFNADGFITESIEQWSDTNYNLHITKVTYNFENGVSTGGTTYVDDKEYNTFSINFINDRKIKKTYYYPEPTPPSKITLVLNAKYRESKRISESYDSSSETDIKYVRSNNYNKDSMHYVIEDAMYKNGVLSAGIKLLTDVDIIQKDKHGNSLERVEIHNLPIFGDERDLSYKIITATYEYY